MPSWPLDLSSIQAPAWLWYGEQDSVAFGEWFKACIPYSRLVVIPGAGHFFVFQAWDDIVTTLAAQDVGSKH
jgi:pimeloyl-ACP methyl ester carboxylesterase